MFYVVKMHTSASNPKRIYIRLIASHGQPTWDLVASLESILFISEWMLYKENS